MALYSEAKCPDCAAFAPTFDAVFNMSCVKTMVSSYEDVPYGNAQQAPDGSITCQHGPTECAGNMIEACAIAHAKTTADWIPFITCMYADYRNVPTNARSCAEQTGLDWAAINKCYGGGTGTEGVALINAAANRTNSLVPSHTYVPWLLVNGTLVPDPPTGGPAQADVLSAICAAYTGPAEACCSAEAIEELRRAHPAPLLQRLAYQRGEPAAESW